MAFAQLELPAPAPGTTASGSEATGALKFPRTARLLKVEGFALEVVAAIHFGATPLLRGLFASSLSKAQFTQLWPPFALDHVVVGLLLVPIGLSTLFLASGIGKGERSAWVLAMINAAALLSLPLAMALLMGIQYFAAPAFLAAATLVTAVGASMWVPLFACRKEFQ